jgi:hypothetical protein
MGFIDNAIKMIFPTQPTSDKEIELLEKKAEGLEHDAKLSEQKARLIERINKAKGTIAESQIKSKGTPSAYGGLMSTGSKKLILIVVGTIAIFALMKFMGC